MKCKIERFRDYSAVICLFYRAMRDECDLVKLVISIELSCSLFARCFRWLCW